MRTYIWLAVHLVFVVGELGDIALVWRCCAFGNLSLLHKLSWEDGRKAWTGTANRLKYDTANVLVAESFAVRLLPLTAAVVSLHVQSTAEHSLMPPCVYDIAIVGCLPGKIPCAYAFGVAF